MLRAPDAVTTYKRARGDRRKHARHHARGGAGGAGGCAQRDAVKAEVSERSKGSGVSFPKPYADAVARLRVLFGFVMVAAFLWFSAPDARSLAVGMPVSALGLALRAWAAGHLEKNRELAQSGPYARVRNPLYLGTLTVAAGLAMAARRWELARVVRGGFRAGVFAGGGTGGAAFA